MSEQISNVEVVEVVAPDLATVTAAVERYAALADAIALMEAEQKSLKKTLMEAHGFFGPTIEAEGGIKSVTVAETVRVGIDADRLAKELPEVFQTYAKETRIAATCRVMRGKASKAS
jgi:nicotinate-nucleotide pyrophosphorylase